MATHLVIESPVSPEAVLVAIREDAREWRESVIPPELREEGRYRVTARVKRDRFELDLPPADEDAEQVTLRGRVSPAAGGGSIVRASFISGRPEFWIVIAGAGALVLFSSLSWGLFLLAAAAVEVGLGEWRNSRLSEARSPTAAYLAGRLRSAVLNASAVTAGRASSRFEEVAAPPHPT
jgi:hypothetical protein